jgi:hypothetical protein
LNPQKSSSIFGVYGEAVLPAIGTSTGGPLLPKESDPAPTARRKPMKKRYGSVFRGFSILVMPVLMSISLASTVKADTISGAANADNAFYIWISTNDAAQSASALGTPILSGNGWPTNPAYSFSDVTLTPGQDYYLLIEAINYGGVGAFIGDFTLSGSDFVFAANDTQTLLTNNSSGEWAGAFNSTNSSITPQNWVEPDEAVMAFGINASPTLASYPDYSNIASNAEWIYPNDSLSVGCAEGSYNGGNCTVDLSTEILYVGPTSAVPEPGSFALLGSALVFALGIGLRKKLLA